MPSRPPAPIPPAEKAEEIQAAILEGRRSALALEQWVTKWPTSATAQTILAQVKGMRSALTLAEQQLIATTR